MKPKEISLWNERFVQFISDITTAQLSYGIGEHLNPFNDEKAPMNLFTQT
jgi:hypothetical protein